MAATRPSGVAEEGWAPVRKICTPYSMNRLFSELFRKFGGGFWEVCETISGGSGENFRGKIKENYSEKIRKK